MRIVCLFNLKPGADRAAYEAWARSTDLPGVNLGRTVGWVTIGTCTRTRSRQ